MARAGIAMKAALRASLPVVGLGLGAVVTTVGPGWGNPWLWGPDLAVGGAFFALSALVWHRSRPTAILALGVGVTWFAGTLLPLALYWHRGPLLHLFLCYPGLRPRSRLIYASCIAGYLAAAVSAVWGSDVGSFLICVALLILVTFEWARSRGRRRTDRRLALIVASLFVLAVATEALARRLIPHFDGSLPALVAYDGVLLVIAGVFAAGTLRPGGARVTDIVVELEEQRSASLSEALARALGDRSLTVGFWDPLSRTFLDASGTPIDLPGSGSQRSATPVELAGRPFMVLVHETAIADDPVLLEAVTAAAVLSSANAELQNRTRAQVAEVAASRQRIVLASDVERRRLSSHVDETVSAPLQRLSENLVAEQNRAGQSARNRLVSAHAHVDEARRVIDEAIAGLEPRELAHGLRAGLAALADRTSLPLRVVGAAPRLDRAIETAIYFACAEAVTNAVKHAQASAISITLEQRGGSLVAAIVDDGRGGADPRGGTGLAGISDRIEALGGEVSIDSPPGAGTRVELRMPVD